MKFGTIYTSINEINQPFLGLVIHRSIEMLIGVVLFRTSLSTTSLLLLCNTEVTQVTQRLVNCVISPVF